MAGLLRHGFKASAERLAIEVRIELELNATDPLDSLQLCAKLGVPVLTIPELIASGASAQSVQCLLSPARSITTDTGWKITIDRGLDIFQRFESGPFSVEQAIQEARLTRGAEVSYVKL